jgi:hypothetical protein
MATMSEMDFEDYLKGIMMEAEGYEVPNEDYEDDEDDEFDVYDVREVRTFKSDGVMTMNKGLSIYMDDGSVFQVTIVKSA